MKGTRGRGGRSSVLNHLDALQREPPPLQTGPSIPRHPPLEAMWIPFVEWTPSDRKRSGKGKGGSWEEGIKFVPCAGGFYWAGELEDSVARVFFESIFSFEVAKIQDHWNNCKEDIVKSSWIAIGYNEQSWN